MSALKRVMALLTLAFVGVAAVTLVLAPVADAHAILESSTPRSGEVVAEADAPGSVQLIFDESVQVTVGSIQVVDAHDHRVDTGSVFHPDGAGPRVAVGLRPALASGSYLVLWRVVSADSHPVHGSLVFSVGSTGAVVAASVPDSPLTLVVALAAARGIADGGLMLALGITVFLLACWRQLWGIRSSRRLLVAATVAAAAGAVVEFVLQAAFDVNGGWGDVVQPILWTSLAGTRFGALHLLRPALIAVAWWALRRPEVPGLRRCVAGLTSLVAAVVTIAASGHGGATPTTVVTDTAHVTAAGVWFGGLLALTVVGLPRLRREVRGWATKHDSGPALFRAHAPAPPVAHAGSAATALLERPDAPPAPEGAAAAVRRFSTLALISVTIVVLTGIVQVLRQVPEPAALVHTHYGQLLLIKLSLVAITLGAAASSRFVLYRRLTRVSVSRGASSARALTWSVAAETLLLVGALAVTSVLVATTPAVAAYRPVQERVVSAGPLTIDISVVPTGYHTVSLHLYASDRAGTLADVPSMTATASGDTSPHAVIDVPLVRAGIGHFLTTSLLLPGAEKWTVSLDVRVDEFDAYPATTDLIAR